MTDPRSSLIVPLMKARVPAELQLEFPLPPDEEPIRDPFAGDLYVSYALEIADEAAPSGRRYEHVRGGTARSWGWRRASCAAAR